MVGMAGVLNGCAAPESYTGAGTLSLHDALPFYSEGGRATKRQKTDNDGGVASVRGSSAPGEGSPFLRRFWFRSVFDAKFAAGARNSS